MQTILRTSVSRQWRASVSNTLALTVSLITTLQVSRKSLANEILTSVGDLNREEDGDPYKGADS